MKLSALLAVLLAAAPAGAQTRAAVRPVALPGIGVSPAAFTPAPNALGALTLSAALTPSLPALTPAFASSPAVIRQSAVVRPSAVIRPAAVEPGRAAVAENLRALESGVALAAASIQKNAGAGADYAAGKDIEALLAGTPLSVPAADAPALSPEAVFALAASPALAARADELGAAKGLKAATMSGGDFTRLIAESRTTTPVAPNPAAAAAAREIETALLRVARALIPADKPLRESLPRALAVWQVFDQEMAIAAAKGGLDALIEDARLFAGQVEASVEPAPKPAALTPSKPDPSDPNGYGKVAVPGSVFGWKPIEESPNHGFPPLDFLIRKLLAQKRSPYVKGFTRSGGTGAPTVFFYGERHTDPGLITENMRRLVADAEPGKPMIVLVESYTGWSLRGFEAVDYLADRGLDTEALEAKGARSGDVEVRGWDTAVNHDASGRPVRQRHMDLLAMNHLAHGELRGWAYYSAMARAAWTTLKRWPELWRAVVTVRNKDLDDAVASAVKEADTSGATVHVIAGTDHLVEHPRLSGIPLIGRPMFRRSLRAAVGGRAWRASQPANTIP